MRDLRLAFRTLFKSPFVTSVAIASLALGIGANAAMFSLFDQMLLRSLPVAERPAELVNLVAPGPKPGSTSCNQAGDCDAVFSYPMYRDLERADAPVALAAHRGFQANVAYQGQTLSAGGTFVSGSYFPVLGLQPARGRLIGAADDQAIGAHPVAVLTHAFWSTRLGSDPAVVGRSITVNGKPLTIIGVAPPGFQGTTLGSEPVLFVPISMRAELARGFDGFDDRRNYWIYAFGRLQPGTSLAQAASALNTTYARIVGEVEAPLQEEMSQQTMAQFRAKRVLLEEGRRGQSSIHQGARTPLLLLFATAAMVLLIACANIANLLLARGATRDLEMSVRLSLGATRARVLAQLLTEACVLALLGGAASLLVARWTLAGIGALLPPEAAATLNFELRLPVILFTAGVAIATGFLFGMFPALHTTRSDLVSTIRANAGNITVTRAATRFRAALVTAQIALSMMLLVCAGLFLKSLVNVSRVELGLKPDDLVTFSVSPVLNGYEPARSKVLFEQLEQELAALPGVTGVTAARVPVLAGDNWVNSVHVQGFEAGPDTDRNAWFNAVSPGHFATLGVPLVAGREFAITDAVGTGKVAIVNEAFVRRFNLGAEPVGKWMTTGRADELDMQIVGVVKDAKYSSVRDEVTPQFFTPWRQSETVGGLAYYVRTRGSTAALLRAIPGVVARLDGNLPVEELRSMPQQVRESLFMERTISILSAAFAGLATLLAAVGLYGVIAFTVARRTREIGVRMALGASAGSVRTMVLRQVGLLLAIGGSIGLLAAWQFGRAAGSLLFGLAPHDVTVMAAAATVLAAFALAAGYLPARRAAAIDPLHALRHD